VQLITVRLKAREECYEIKIGEGLLSSLGHEARACLGPKARRVAVVSNPTVFGLFEKHAGQSLQAAGFTVRPWLMPDGERYKSLRTLGRLLSFLSDAGFERSDAIVALGGGVVGDLAGFAAATYMRGVALINGPTTLLAQIDASVGGKTGVNTPSGKNLVGAFHQPRLVLIDTSTLSTLPRRELTSGWCEAVKQGAIGSRTLFDQTCEFLSSIDFSLWSKEGATQTEVYATQLAEIIAAHCRFKASMVVRDEKEDVARADHCSRRILNFGHTVAHALETVTNYRRFRHGEAVGYGMLVAGDISKSLGILAASELELLRAAVRLCGRLPRADDIELSEIVRALARDKKVVEGTIKWVLLERIGRARIVDGREIDPRVLRSSLRAGLQRLS
jgi:3-dehydroquinate synthase